MLTARQVSQDPVKEMMGRAHNVAPSALFLSMVP